MHHQPFHRSLAAALWAACMALAPAGALAAGEAPASQALAPDAPALPYARSVGEATQRLLALQREGQAASAVPRPVPGEVAQRSRTRYLNSFEHEIPEFFKPSVGEKKAAGSR